jgi:hypothetical protein
LIGEDDVGATQVWTDSQATAYQPLVLSGVRQGRHLTAGLAVLAADGGQISAVPDAPLLRAIATQLLADS